MKNIIFHTKHYEYLAREIAQNLSVPLGKKTINYFPDQERYMKVDESIINQNIIIVGGTISDADTLEMYDLACACAKYGASSITLVIPYYGYSTMERATKPGEVVPAKTRARLLSTIPSCPGGNRILLLDLHSEGIPYYFEGNVQVFHLYAKEVLMEQMKKISSDFVLAATDAGRAKWVESLAKEMGVSPAFVYKQRLSGSQTTVTGVNAQVQDKVVIIYDDMIRTGSSLIGAAKAYEQAGAKEIYALTTHGVFPKVNQPDGNHVSALEKIQNAGVFKGIYATNSHPHALELKENCLSVAKVFSDFISKYL